MPGSLTVCTQIHMHYCIGVLGHVGSDVDKKASGSGTAGNLVPHPVLIPWSAEGCLIVLLHPGMGVIGPGGWV